MHHRSVEAQQRGNLILVEHRPSAQCGQNEPACLRAIRFLLQLLSNRVVGRGEVHKNGVLQDLRWY